MDFARKQLEKYGWSDGKGLGKNENGITEPLKPKLKRSVTGVGYDPAKDFTEHWWSELYNKAASNVQVKEKNGKTKKMKAIDKDFEITNSTWRLKKKRNSHSEEEYSDFFVKTDILDNEGTKCVRVEVESEEEDVVKMSDEELFKACGGRTAHKGARHGLRALGKLARIEQQEQELLHESRFQGYSHAKNIKETSNSDQETDTDKSKRKKKKKLFSNDAQETLANNDTNDIESQIDTDSSLNKVKKKKTRKNISEHIHSDDEQKLMKKPKKKNKDKLLHDADATETPKQISGLQVTLEIDEVLIKKGSKKKKKNK